jgi:hypothetical protein
MTFERRMQALERRFAAAIDTDARSGPDPDLIAIFDELSALKSSRAVHYRAGVRIEPENIPQKILGDNYTRAELRELAIARAFEGQGRSAAEMAELIPRWLERFDYTDALVRAIHMRRDEAGGATRKDHGMYLFHPSWPRHPLPPGEV